jgi:hypothetical protein
VAPVAPAEGGAAMKYVDWGLVVVIGSLLPAGVTTLAALALVH